MSELKPCPFCGSTVYLLDVATQPSGIELWDVYCANHQCYLSGGTNNMYETRHLAIEAWNSRVEPPELAVLREQVNVLRNACKSGILQIEYLHRRFSETGSGNGTIAQIESILEQTKSKGGE